MDSTNLTPFVFGAITLAGVLYVVYGLFIGGELGDVDIATGVPEDASQVGCTAIAAFLAGFGAVGVLGSLSEWNLLLTLGAAVVFGLIVGRVFVSVLRIVARQQGSELRHTSTLVGASARVTTDAPAGMTGEAMIEDAYVTKYPVRSVAESALSRGDHVEVVDVRDGTLYVKKKRQG